MADRHATASVPDDLIQPFQIENFGVRGRLVRLGPLVDSILGRHDYPEPVAAMLGELLALAAVLSGALKFDGVFSVQTRSDGPVSYMVADVTTTGEMRGYARFDDARLAKLASQEDADSGASEPVPRLLGTGYLAFTVDQGPDTERYQGIVELAGATLADCAHNYFRQSEQMDAAVKLAVGRSGEEGWRAAGMMVQRLPGQSRQPVSGEPGDEGADEGWRRAVVMMGASTTGELLDSGLHPHRLLYRLFHEDGVRVYEPVGLSAGCRCSRERVERTLRSFPRAEIAGMKVDGKVVVTCEFCGARYVLDDDALDALYDA
jgi:molecular chaperone Hsp33